MKLIFVVCLFSKSLNFLMFAGWNRIFHKSMTWCTRVFFMKFMYWLSYIQTFTFLAKLYFHVPMWSSRSKHIDLKKNLKLLIFVAKRKKNINVNQCKNLNFVSSYVFQSNRNWIYIFGNI
jgi:hypothetical protein